MNYLVAVDTFFPDKPSGSGRVAWDIAQMMRDLGNKVTVFCTTETEESQNISEYEGIKIVRFLFPKTASLDPFKLQKQKNAGIKIVRKYLAKTKWDVVHIHIYYFGDILYGVLDEGPRYLYTVHSPVVLEQEINWGTQGISGKIKLLIGKGALKKRERKLLQRVHAIHTLSGFTKEYLDTCYGIGYKTSIIPHWCRKDFYRQSSKTDARIRYNWPLNAKLIFTVRRLVSRMGVDTAIKAIAPLLKDNDDVYFVIAGSGPQEQYLKNLAISLNVSDKIWFLGCVNDEMLKICYEASDLFLLPTQSLECFGLPVIEALSYGLPIISTDVAAIPELMRPILPQCITRAGSVEDLRQKLEQFLSGVLNLPESSSLIEYVQNNFGADVIIPRILRFIEGRF